VAALESAHARMTALGLPVPSCDVVIFLDLAAMQPYAPPGRAVGLYQQGIETSFLVVAWKDAGDPLRALAHELAHSALVPGIRAQPLWLREGLAEVLSNLQPALGGLRIGAPIGGHLETLRKRPWLEWRRVLDAVPDSPILLEAESNKLFYAQSWLLAHSLVVGRSSGKSFAARIEALSEPAELPGRVPESLAIEFVPARAAAPQTEAKVRALEPWEHDYRLAELLRAMNRAGQAREALESLRSQFPQRPEPAESLGALDMDALEYRRAEERLGEAVRLGSENPSTHYRYSLLLMQPGKSAETAARHARRAVELDPSQPLHWLAQAQAEMQLGRWEAARSSLAGLDRRAADPLLREQVKVETAEIERRQEQQRRPPPTPQPPEKVAMAAAPQPPSISPPPPAPAARPKAQPHPGALTFWGFIRRVECTEEGKILTVTSPRFTVRVREPAGRPARLYSPPRNLRQIPCTLKDVEVNVVYRPAARFGPINGDLVAVIF